MSLQHNEYIPSQESPFSGDVKKQSYQVQACPECGLTFTDTQFETVYSKGSLQVLHIECDDCSHKIVTVLATTSYGVSSLRMTTDLSAEDFMKTKHRESISMQSLLNYYEELDSESFLPELYTANYLKKSL